MTHRSVSIGLIGVPRDRIDETATALLRQPRLQLTQVYDPCWKTAEGFAGRIVADVAPSIRELLRCCRGVIVGNAGWLGDLPLRWSIQQQHPLLALGSTLLGMEESLLEELHRLNSSQGTLVMPDLLHRWCPSTIRLRELTATRIGAVESLSVEYHQPSLKTPLLTSVVDWCGNVIQSQVLEVRPAEASDAVRLLFRRRAQSGEPVWADVRCTADAGDPLFPLSAKVRCRHGSAEVHGAQELSWRIGHSVSRESLTQDRSAWDLMFDLFGRRLAGGIVPVPDLADVRTALRIRSGVERCGETGESFVIHAHS